MFNTFTPHYLSGLYYEDYTDEMADYAMNNSLFYFQENMSLTDIAE